MKTVLILIGAFMAGTYIVSTNPADIKRTDNASPTFRWTQVAPNGTGTFPEEWQQGKYPMGLIPLVAFNNELWITGQQYAYASADGIHWKRYKKNDWSERISTAQVFFNGKLWMLGGMKLPGQFQNDVWSSSDGKNWKEETTHAPWKPRKGHKVVVFDNKLWLFGGSTAVNKDLTPKDFLNDIWNSADGVNWKLVTSAAAWKPREYPRVVAHQNELWLLGGQGHSDIWKSKDGRDWQQVSGSSVWGDRFDFGACVYNNVLFVYGGRDTDPYISFNDVWFSIDGKTWHEQSKQAPWSVRDGMHSVVFQNKLWLFSGKHKAHDRVGDIWTME